MNIENWKMDEPNEQRVYYVREFIGLDGSRPPDLVGKSMDEPAYIENRPQPTTLRFQSADNLPVGKHFLFQNVPFSVARREGVNYWAIEVKI